MAGLKRMKLYRSTFFLDRTTLRRMFWGLWIAGIAVLGYVLWHAAKDTTEFWNVTIPGIATAAGTTALAIATGYLALGDRVDERARSSEAAREQAMRVITVYTASPTTEVTAVKVINASERPIFDMWVDGADLVGRFDTYRVSDQTSDCWVAVLPPGDSCEMTGRLTQRPTTHWTDSANQRWVRCAREEPTTQPREQAPAPRIRARRDRPT